jgi:hypothetical protein
LLLLISVDWRSSPVVPLFLTEAAPLRQDSIVIDRTKELPAKGCKRLWPPRIKLQAAAKAKVESHFGLR